MCNGKYNAACCNRTLTKTPEGWLLNAGEAYFYRDEMGSDQRRCTPELRFYQWMMEVDREARLHNQNRLRVLSSDPTFDVRLFCSHDAVEFIAFADQSSDSQKKNDYKFSTD
ncbi:hypothetical protein H6F97_00545 [Microcoleus sp. FACHB-1]|nr:hypothetical protein [Microcoleus sp. FACHB-1]